MYSAAKSHVVSVLGPPPTRYAVHMTLELNRTASTAEQLNSLLTQIMENFSVSDHEGPLTDEVEAFLNEQEHLTVRRHGDTVVASTDFGKPSRVILAGHLDTVPVIDNFPPKWLEPGDSLIREEIAHAHPEDRVLWGRGATDMKASDAVMLYLAATLDGRTPETTPKVDLTYVFYDHEEVVAEKNGLRKVVEAHPDWITGDFAIIVEPTNSGIEGGCNCQFALKPDSFDYAVIEVNPRVSRSSALASKATGYPIAKVATKIAIGYTLDEITNDVTGKTCACFEPALDYIVVKYPKWPFDKFVYADKSLGTQMMATGEVMSIGNSFEAAMMKAVSSIELGMDTLTHKPFEELSDDEIVDHMYVQDAERVFCVYEALKRGIDHETIYRITKIDWWFLDKMQHLADLEKGLAKCEGVLSEAQYKEAKKYGFQDKTIKRLAKVDKLPVENYRAGFKMVDTCAAEFSANTPYFYSTYDGDNEAAEFIAEKEAEASAKGEPRKKKVLVFGSGPIRIGQGIEFDYCSVHCVWTLKKHGCEAILVNNNPETVSTDFDTGDRLYFDPLNPESVDNIIATEKPDACVVQFGGQTAIKLAKHMDEIGLPILGTPADAIDEAEDRERFDELLERCNIPRAPGRTVFDLEEALAAADEIGLPVLMRPSYVLGGQNMIVAYTKADVIEYMGVITEHVDMDHPVLLDKYIMGTECEVDAICDGENYLIPGIMEQVERTGVHSGDSICVYPAQHLTQAEIDTIVDYTGRFARELHVNGLVNVQYAVSNGKVYVIEVNPRSSRTVPYISKVTGVPMVDLAVRCCLGEKLTDMGYGTGLHPNAPYVAVKVPVFSFEKLHGVDTQFGPEMKSTGEVLGIAPNYHDALLKGLIGAGYTFKTPGPASCCIFTVKDSDKPEFVDIAWKLKSMGYKLYGTSGTCAWLNKHMVPCNEVRNMSGESPNIVDLLQSGLVDYVFSTSAKGRDPKRDSVRLRRKAVELSIPCITAVDTANALVDCLRSDHSMKDIPLVDIATLYHKK